MSRSASVLTSLPETSKTRSVTLPALARSKVKVVLGLNGLGLARPNSLAERNALFSTTTETVVLNDPLCPTSPLMSTSTVCLPSGSPANSARRSPFQKTPASRGAALLASCTTFFAPIAWICTPAKLAVIEEGTMSVT